MNQMAYNEGMDRTREDRDRTGIRILSQMY